MKYKYTVDVSKLNLSLEDQKNIDQKNAFELLFTNLMSSKYPQGIRGQTVRTLNSIWDKLDDTKEEYLELEQREIDLLKEIIMDDEIPLHPAQARYHKLLKNNLLSSLSP